MQTDEEVGKVAAAVPVIICILVYIVNTCSFYLKNNIQIRRFDCQ